MPLPTCTDLHQPRLHGSFRPRLPVDSMSLSASGWRLSPRWTRVLPWKLCRSPRGLLAGSSHPQHPPLLLPILPVALSFPGGGYLLAKGVIRIKLQARWGTLKRGSRVISYVNVKFTDRQKGALWPVPGGGAGAGEVCTQTARLTLQLRKPLLPAEPPSGAGGEGPLPLPALRFI